MNNKEIIFLKYKIEGSDFNYCYDTSGNNIWDSAICVNPNDERFAHLKGRKAIVPICGRVIPIIRWICWYRIWDWLFEKTPAHDMNDKALGETQT
jgi:valyl-tRNA synthetase